MLSAVHKECNKLFALARSLSQQQSVPNLIIKGEELDNLARELESSMKIVVIMVA
jgi:hypothetical protein